MCLGQTNRKQIVLQDLHLKKKQQTKVSMFQFGFAKAHHPVKVIVY